MNKQERITLLMSLLQASLDGKEVEQNDCGHYYDSNIYHATIDNVHQFRVKPNKVTKKYRVALFKDFQQDAYTSTVDEEEYLLDTESNCLFVRWLGDWQTYTVEE